MSHDILDDPMDTSASDRSAEANSVPAAEPAPPGEREMTPIDSSKQPHAVRLSEKRDVEGFDDGYELMILEPAVDVEAMSYCYQGNAFLLRCRFVARHCSALRADAYIAMINYLRENSKDITHYMAFFNELELELAKEKKTGTVNLPIPIRDLKWVEETGNSWQSTLEMLQGEFKRHKDEGVKESTRRAMEDLFNHYMSAGRPDDAIRLYGRGIRDYCTQLKHSINMWLNWIEVAIVAHDFPRLENVTNTAFRSLKDAYDAEKNGQNAALHRADNTLFMVDHEAGVSAASSALSNQMLIEAAMAKCVAAQCILNLRSRRYDRVVELVRAVKIEHLSPKWFLTGSDMGIYGILCAMATMERPQLKRCIGGSGTFRKLLESEPAFIELLSAYTSSRFGRCFEIMFTVKTRLLLDPFFSKHVQDLFKLIRMKCVVQYMIPYSTIKMESMCAALGSTIPELQAALLDLLETKTVAIRIDQHAGVVRMIDDKDEATTLRRVNKTCDRAILRAKSLLWKTTLAGANIHALVDKETRQKRKQGRPTDRHVAFDVDDEAVSAARRAEGTSSSSVPLSDDFNIALEQSATHEDLGDI